MRILHTLNFLAIGGAETMALQLAKEQRRLGHDVTVCSMYGEGPLDARAAEFGVSVVHLGARSTRLGKIRALYKHLRKHQYDVLHSHWEVWLATSIAGFLRGIPRVHTNHSNYPRRLFLEHRIACFFTNKVVVLTPYLEPYIAKWVAVPKRKIEIVPNGVDLAPLESAIRIEVEGIPHDAPVVGMIARLFPPKDYPTYIKAAHLLEQTHPDLYFLAIGAGQMRGQLEEEAARLGLKNFRFLGFRLDVAPLLKRMTVNVLSSKHEGQPISLLEAMACGCPCVGTDIPAIRTVLDNGKTGILVPGNDPGALAEAIARFLDDPGLRKEFRDRALEYVKQFSVKQMAESYIDIYQRMGASTRCP